MNDISAQAPAFPPPPRQILLAKRLLAIALMGVALAACTRNDTPVAIVPIADRPQTLNAAPIPLLLTVNSGAHRYTLMFDTGASLNVLDAQTAARNLSPLSDDALAAAQRYRLPLHENVNLIEGAAKLRYYHAEPLHYGRWAIPSSNVIATVDAPQITNMSRDLGMHIDGVVGMSAIGTLNWTWDRKAGRLEGYRFGSTVFATQRQTLTCIPMDLQADGTPSISLDIGEGVMPFMLDTGAVGALSGELSVAGAAILRHLNWLSNETTVGAKPPQKGGAPVSLTAMQLKTASLGDLRLNGLVFTQRRDLGPSYLGLAFLHRFDKIALDFETLRFCFAQPVRVAPDRFPARAELQAFLSSP